MKTCALLLALLCFVIGCDNSNSPQTIKLQLNWKPEPQFGGFYTAAEQGLYQKHGLNVEVVPGGVGTPTVQMLGAGSVDFAIVSADELIIARSKGNDVVALFAVYQTNPQGLMTHESRGFTQIGDIFKSDGTVAMQEGLPYAQFLKRKFGFERVKVVPSPGGSIAQFQHDEKFTQQCFITSEPLAAARAGVKQKTFLVADAGFNPYTTVLATSGKYLKSNEPKVRAMISAVREGWQAYQQSSDASNAFMHKLNPTMDVQTFAESAKAQTPLVRPEGFSGELGSMTAERWQTLGKQLVELHLIDKAPPAAECFFDPK